MPGAGVRRCQSRIRPMVLSLPPPPPRPAPLPRMLGVRAKGPCRPPLTPLNRELGLLPWSHSAGHGTHCCRLRDGDDPGMMVLASPKGHPGCCVWGSQVGCNQQCRDHLTRAQFGVCGEELVARAQHLCPGALQTSPPKLSWGPTSRPGAPSSGEVLGVSHPGRALGCGVQPGAGGHPQPETLPWAGAGTGGPAGHCPSRGPELGWLLELPATPLRSWGPPGS